MLYRQLYSCVWWLGGVTVVGIGGGGARYVFTTQGRQLNWGPIVINSPPNTNTVRSLYLLLEQAALIRLV